LETQHFVDALRARLTTALSTFNRVLPRLSHVRIFRPRTQDERGLWALAKLEPQPEPQHLGLLKDTIRHRYGMLDLLDVLVAADSLVGFTHFFTHSGTKEVRSREVLRPLLLLDVFAEGTNMGIRRVANANDQYGYDELLYMSAKPTSRRRRYAMPMGPWSTNCSPCATHACGATAPAVVCPTPRALRVGSKT
jgi:hypothetical protein